MVALGLIHRRKFSFRFTSGANSRLCVLTYHRVCVAGVVSREGLRLGLGGLERVFGGWIRHEAWVIHPPVRIPRSRLDARPPSGAGCLHLCAFEVAKTTPIYVEIWKRLWSMQPSKLRFSSACCTSQWLKGIAYYL